MVEAAPSPPTIGYEFTTAARRVVVVKRATVIRQYVLMSRWIANTWTPEIIKSIKFNNPFTIFEFFRDKFSTEFARKKFTISGEMR